MQRIKLVLGLLVLSVSVGGCRVNQNSLGREVLAVEEQGSFAVGGTVVTAPGKFDPIADGAFNPANQSSEGQTL
jgi:hypothetical protein